MVENNNMGKVVVDFAERLADKKGMTFYFYRSHVNADGQRVYKNAAGQEVPAGNGYYDPRDGSIHIDLNAGDEGSAMLSTIAHELTHFIQDWSPEKYRTFCRILMEGYADRGQSVRELVLAKQEKYRQELGIELTYEQAYDEVIASSMESVLNDGNVMDLLDQLETADKSLWEKFRSFLEEIAELIHRTIQAFRGVHPESPEGRIVERMTEIHSQLQQAFAEGLHEGGENYRTGGKENTAREGGVKYSYGSIREIMAKKGLDELSKKYGDGFPLSAGFDKAMSTNQTPLTMHIVQANQVTYGNNISAYKTGRNSFINTYGVKTGVHIKQMDIDAMLYADMVKESISKAIGQPNEQSTLDVIPKIKEIISDSVLLGIERIAHTGNKGTVLYGYRLYNLYWYDTGGKKTPNCLVSTVVQSTNAAEGYVFHNIENVTVDQGLPGINAGMPPSTNGNTYTVSQLYRTVKKIDREKGGLKYSQKERDKYLFHYTERNDGKRYSARYQQNESAAQHLQQENSRMTEDVVALTPLVQALRKMNGGKMRTAYLAEAVAYLKKTAGARGNSTELGNLLSDFYSYVTHNDDYTWEDIREKAKPVAAWLMDNATYNKTHPDSE